MRPAALPLYAAAHFWVDLSCALLVLGRLDAGLAGLAALFWYNLCAFALQLPLGALADRLGRPRAFAALGCLLAALAWTLPGLLPAALCTGIGNALFHVGGGLYTLDTSPGCGALGIFVSPGALGIFLGGLAPVRAALPSWLAWGVLLLLAPLLAAARPEGTHAPFSPLPAAGGAISLLLLFAVVVLRAWVGGLSPFPWKGDLGLPLALAVAGGKALGGLLADRFGPGKTACLSLALAFPCFLFSGHPVPGLLAVCLFNMTMPLTLWGAARLLPGAKGLAFGLLTFALFLGSLPALLLLPQPSGTLACAAGAVCSLPLLLLGLRLEVGRC